jgi:hypothetical protein
VGSLALFIFITLGNQEILHQYTINEDSLHQLMEVKQIALIIDSLPFKFVVIQQRTSVLNNNLKINDYSLNFSEFCILILKIL